MFRDAFTIVLEINQNVFDREHFFSFYRYTQLNIVEKIILSMVHFMLSNKIARLFVFAYSVLLHLLVFVVLMTMAYNDSYRREQAISEWQQKYLDHMNEAHQAMDHHAGNG